MKNILGKSENLKLYNKEGNILYDFYFNPNSISTEYTYNQNGNQLTFKNSNGYKWEKTFNLNGRELTFKDSDGISWEYTYDENGNELTYKHSNGISRGFEDERNDYNSIPMQHTQTAVEWLVEQCPRIKTIVAYDILEQAKQMEKEQIKKANMDGYNEGCDS